MKQSLHSMARIMIVTLLVTVFSHDTRSADIFAITTVGEKVILRDNGTWHYENHDIEEKHQVSYSKDYFFSEDGYEKLVKVSFDYDEKISEKIPERILRQVVLSSLLSAKAKAKNSLSFVPRKLTIRLYDHEFNLKRLDDQSAKEVNEGLKNYSKEVVRELEKMLDMRREKWISKFKDCFADIHVTWLAKNAYGAEGEETSEFKIKRDFSLVEW
jgi:hypothetical protein